MDQWESALLLAETLGHTTREGITAIASVLSHFAISSSKCVPASSDTPIYTITINTPSRDDLRAVFDTDLGHWDVAGGRDVRSRPYKVDLKADGILSASIHDSERTADDCCGMRQTWNHLKTPVVQDWTRLLPPTEHVEFLKSRDWASTALGPMQGWPNALQLMTLKMLSDPRPANLYWGPSHIAIYNAPFVLIAHSRHPIMMGSTAQDSMPATWPFLSQVFKEVARTGVAFSIPEFEMTVEKTQGFMEEAWYDGVFSPIKDTDGQLLGLYNSGFENTDLKIAGRRSQLLHQISASPDFKKVSPWQHIVDSCRNFERDIPFLIVYSAVTEDTTTSQRCSLHLEGTLGISQGHPVVPEFLDLSDGTDGFIPALRAARSAGSFVLQGQTDDKLRDFLAHDVKWRGFGDAATHIVIMPLFVTGSIGGFLIFGLNPRRPYDDLHRRYIEDIGRVSTGLLALGISADQAQIREKRLSEALTTKEKFMSKVVEVVTVGIYCIDSEGLITWANSKFYEMTGMSKRPEEAYNLSVMAHVLEQDRARATESFHKSISEKIEQTIELRLSQTWKPPGSSENQPRWILGSSTPTIENGVMVGLLGCITDISNVKWAEQLQFQIAEAAKEAKLQQERFVDMTSHEIRNPLGAILQCADDICTISQMGQRQQLSTIGSSRDTDLFFNIAENAETILFCAAHQKRVIDDILTVSKLNSSMLLITPICADPVAVTMEVLKMHGNELAVNDIKFSVTQTSSYQDLGLRWALLDPSRLTQILINLLTNAIKFTKESQTREVHIRIGASTCSRLTSLWNGDGQPKEIIQVAASTFAACTETHSLSVDAKKIQWFPGSQAKNILPASLEDNAKDDLYISFEVQDTGRGISADEMAMLFHRFSQGNPKTHIQYGGSGLGLFISRELVELHGGMIGAVSSPGAGSTFAFYIKIQRISTEDIEAHQQEKPNSGRRRSSQIQPPLVISQPATNIPATLRRMSNSTAVSNPKRKTSIPSTTSRGPALSILLVEDNVINQKILSKQLRNAGCTVKVANHGVEALGLLKATRLWQVNGSEVQPPPTPESDFDIILMDWEMPIMDGLTCTGKIRELEHQGLITTHLPIIATTANVRPEQVRMIFDTGADDFLAKPFTVKAVMDRIDKLLKR
ncbi:hypothetical protein BP6252_06760 [Coleophoma cylindrospora]|uniref:Uncharacterized protein n=1 Tax=Coleophoma cylindrospora TaxID=1849047 RepID=A0A3D8RFM4_9HELO|nr:hypothetical protein BP6252_06760 [Coleophoma cylindrospora]